MNSNNKTVILSSNSHKDYISYLPFVQKAWNLIGWNTLTFYLGDMEIESSDKNRIIKINSIEGYRDETVVQVSRLFGAKYLDGMIMTSDVDMMPLSDYWHPEQDRWTAYGADLTGYKHFPICYICANKKLWNEVITENSIEEILLKEKNSKSNDFNEWWYTDQEIITKRLFSQDVKSIDRGTNLGLAKGRIDRASWETTKLQEHQKVDAHMPRPFDKNEAEYLLNNILSV